MDVGASVHASGGNFCFLFAEELTAIDGGDKFGGKGQVLERVFLAKKTGAEKRRLG